MKFTIKYIPLFIALWLLISCDDNKPLFDNDITIIVDKTDRMTAYPTADEITGQLGLKDNPWQGLRITTTYISDKDVNDVTVLTLEAENEWSGNIMMRKAKVQHFIKQLQRCLTAMVNTGTCPYSIIYRTIARQANRLMISPAHSKLLLVYSDLKENDVDLNFYDSKVMTRIQKNPQSVVTQLEATARLKPLNGLQLWLIYNPVSFTQNNTYMSIAGFYQHLFSANGAEIHIANKYVQQ
ncbi:MAG TPA: hypothetical protein VFE53_26985 [Mucilaginibacter sp.]|jgi:hypothetical protein|nr:hypothetical protein [Mucilaginibacter sp.]